MSVYPHKVLTKLEVRLPSKTCKRGDRESVELKKIVTIREKDGKSQGGRITGNSKLSSPLVSRYYV